MGQYYIRYEYTIVMKYIWLFAYIDMTIQPYIQLFINIYGYSDIYIYIYGYSLIFTAIHKFVYWLLDHIYISS